MALLHIKKSINKKKFKSFFSKKVILNMKHCSSIILDNVRFHDSKVITNYVSKKGIELIYTVPYTPELNPIENAFSIIKRFIKHKGTNCFYNLKNTMAAAMPLLTSNKCTQMFQKSFGLTNYRIVRN